MMQMLLPHCSGHRRLPRGRRIDQKSMPLFLSARQGKDAAPQGVVGRGLALVVCIFVLIYLVQR
jgi:hypothetical protein